VHLFKSSFEQKEGADDVGGSKGISSPSHFPSFNLYFPAPGNRTIPDAFIL